VGRGKAGRATRSGEAGKARGAGRAAKSERLEEAGKDGFVTIKTERLPDGRTKRILKDRSTGRIIEKVD